MKWLRWYTVLLLILIVAYVYAVYKKPVAINWERTLSNKDKIPYGTFVAYESLQYLFPNAEISINKSNFATLAQGEEEKKR